jgi:hypothetical protein
MHVKSRRTYEHLITTTSGETFHILRSKTNVNESIERIIGSICEYVVRMTLAQCRSR